MHRFRCANDLSAIALADRLVTEADAKYGDFAISLGVCIRLLISGADISKPHAASRLEGALRLFGLKPAS